MSNIWDDKAVISHLIIKNIHYVKNRSGNYVSLYGDRLKNITKWDKDQPGLFESDVSARDKSIGRQLYRFG